jgi:hypothetical protein
MEDITFKSFPSTGLLELLAPREVLLMGIFHTAGETLPSFWYLSYIWLAGTASPYASLQELPATHWEKSNISWGVYIGGLLLISLAIFL